MSRMVEFEGNFEVYSVRRYFYGYQCGNTSSAVPGLMLDNPEDYEVNVVDGEVSDFNISKELK